VQLSQSQLSAPATVAFGQVGVTTTATRLLTLSNTTGNQAIVVSAINLSGSNEFTYTAPVALPFIIPVGSSLNLTVNFSPLANGSKAATVAISHSGTGGSTSVSLSGDGVNGPNPTNTAPVLAPIGNKSLSLLQSLTFKATATDAENHALQYSLAGTVPAGAAINAATGAFAWTPQAAGTYTFTVKVTDNGSPAAADDEQITVSVSAASQQTVVSLTLINADTDQDIGLLTNDAVVNFSAIGTNRLNVRANTNPATVGSVVFQLDGTVVRTESVAPYALAGDSGGDYMPWTPALGNRILTATPYSASGGTGTRGAALTVNFTVVASGAARLSVEKDAATAALAVDCYPNPFNRSFTLRVKGKGPGKLPVVIHDLYGKVVMRLDDVQAEETIVLGERYAPGVYFLQLGKGNETRRLKLVKIQ
jgi:hypothetical protein